MILGFPGSTSRYLTASEVRERMETTNQAEIDVRGVRLEVLREKMAASDKTRIQYANKFAGSSNYWKNSIGMNEAIIKNKVLETKAEQERLSSRSSHGCTPYAPESGHPVLYKHQWFCTYNPVQSAYKPMMDPYQ